MNFSKTELPLLEANLREICDSLNHPEFLDKLRHDFRIEGLSIILFEVRPHWQKPKQTIESEYAKLRYFKSRGEWQLYWMRQDLNWYLYEPHPIGKGYMPLLRVIEEDAYHCFFG